MNGYRKWRAWFPILILAAGLPGASAGLTIYRFGGTGLPPPPEAGSPGVEFVEMAWQVEASAGGDTAKIREEEGTIGPLQFVRWYDVAPAHMTLDPDIEAIVDDNAQSFWWAPAYLCSRSCFGSYGAQGIINLDLGDEVQVYSIKFISGDSYIVGNTHGVRNLGISLSSSRLVDLINPHTPFIVEIQDNHNQELNIPIPPGQQARWVQIALSEHSNPWRIAEIQLYIWKAAEQASYTSNIIDAGRPVVWNAARWSLHREAESRVFLRTRSGEDVNLNRYWRYTGIGDQRLEVTRTEYEQLRSSERAGISHNYASWSMWPSGFDMADTLNAPPIFPRPRRAFQFGFDFLSTGERGSQVEFVEIHASQPAVSQIVGELEPIQVQAGERTRFTYTLKPSMQSADTGFDRLEISAVAARLDDVQAVWINGLEVPFEVESLADRYFVVSFPRMNPLDSDTIIEVIFNAQVLRYGGAFSGSISDSRRPFDLPQPVLAGNALDEVDSDRLWIETTIAVRSVLTAQAAPAVLTPNGDGINDQVRIIYSLFETIGGVPVEVEIRDLAGRRVRRVHTGQETIGRYEHLWDGRDEDGRPVPPGIYVYRVETEISGERIVAAGALRVVY